MEFLDKLGSKMNDAYKKTAEKTSQISNEIKCKMRIEKIKGEIQAQYEQIGSKVYSLYYKEEVDLRRNIKLECAEIERLKEELVEAEKGNLDEDLAKKPKESNIEVHAEIISDNEEVEKVEDSSSKSD